MIFALRCGEAYGEAKEAFFKRKAEKAQRSFRVSFRGEQQSVASLAIRLERYRWWFNTAYTLGCVLGR